MGTTVDIFQIIIMVIFWISETILNFSIIIIYVREWKKKQQFSVSDKIFIHMALSNLLLQCCTAIDGFIYVFWFYQLIMRQGSVLIFIVNLCFIYDNIWHSAWLSIHYCLKLVDPSHRVFVEMKKRFSSSIITIIIVTLVGVFLITLPYIWTVKMELLPNKTIIIHHQIPFTTCNVLIDCCLPFMVTVVCIGLSVGSLVRHMSRIRHHASQFSSSPQLQGHVRATRTMTLQLLLNLLLYVSVIGLFTYSLNPDRIWDVIFWSSFLFYPCAQTLILILGNPKFKKRNDLVNIFKEILFCPLSIPIRK